MFRKVIVVSIIGVALAGTAVLAQGLRGRAANRAGLGGRGVQRIERLQQRLNLTDVQVNGLRTLQENRKREMQTLRQEIKPKREELRQLLRQPNPNSNDVGNATLALRESRDRMRDINQRYLSGMKGLLTPDQLQKLPKRLQ